MYNIYIYIVEKQYIFCNTWTHIAWGLSENKQKNIFYRKDFKIKNGSVRIILSEKKGREYVDSKKPTISTFY